MAGSSSRCRRAQAPALRPCRNVSSSPPAICNLPCLGIFAHMFALMRMCSLILLALSNCKAIPILEFRFGLGLPERGFDPRCSMTATPRQSSKVSSRIGILRPRSMHGPVGKLEFTRQDRERIGKIKKVSVVYLPNSDVFEILSRLAKFDGVEYSDTPPISEPCGWPMM